MSGPAAWPSVGVVVPTHDRPAQLRATLAAIHGQDYGGDVRTVVVFDRSAPDTTLASEKVTVIANQRTPGLAGARNSGILVLDTDLVAFCDDDDVWLPGKLTAQVGALRLAPAADFASCGIIVEFNGTASPRLVGASQVSYADLLRSRMVMVHSSTYLIRRPALLAGIGLVDEQAPGGQNEDWDLALRAARRGPIVLADEPLVRVAWGNSSYFATQWEAKAAGLKWLLDRHPDIRRSRPGSARVYAQIAFAYACLGQRREAGRWAVRALRRNWHERRVPFVLAVASGMVSGDSVLRVLHKHGHGI